VGRTPGSLKALDGLMCISVLGTQMSSEEQL
jgi:hypothetical protein